MDTKVIGAGVMFLGSGCGPALSTEQRQYLSSINPQEFYPCEDLLAMLEAAKNKDPKLVSATGKRWGTAIKGEFDKDGLTDIKKAATTLAQVYLQHHQGEAGKLTVELGDDSSFIATNAGIYPNAMIFSAFEGLITALGGEDVLVEQLEQEDKARISWGG